ncbi:Similar to S.cerevisiae protein SEC7 (Guanine nucleotide exchange factor (GEF) for ADP ribosylation factors) [Malassezia sympodialis ATCC 42132]|uniref:Similar to S.cerevisiae protein SEC7 (Guanine nucleotide exchange factor (GEF) for ADP ribosylation factors) n=2 Tax=Malassezia sympodialis (strain ATCC 42132) TaxID=1230383 RepID=A0A1M8AAZ0_MALS4|nr:Similar to S.cerevisiae protein SEC7 (Guanine nucleotide exchange factor (GEF) for ADP ribosylation factors) [Malassezia sympodialis ATCC 42132]
MASEEPGHKSADAGMEQGVPAVPSSAPSQPNSASQEGNLLGMDTAVPESLASEPPAPDHAPEQDESESKQGFHAETALEYASESPSKEKPVRDEEETSPQPVPAPNEAAAPAAEVQNAEVAPAETLAPVERSNEHASSENRAPLGDATSTADSDPVPVSTEGTEAGSLRPSMQTEPVQEIGERVVQHSASSASSLSRGSAVFVLSALETISSSKEARRSKPLKESAVAALDMVKAATSPDSTSSVLDPRVVFEPLRLACETKSVSLQASALDCIAKLVSYAFFAEDDPNESALADLVVDTVCDCFGDQMDERVSVQIVKALLACVLSTSIRVHQSSLLRAVRTVYNIYLMARTPSHQAIAQGALSQMVGHVFSRVPRAGGTSEVVEPANTEPVTLQMLESRHSLDAAERDEMAPIDAPDLHVKDAFLLLRALCKLSMKPLSSESERDVKSYSMRSKLLALRTVRGVLQQHMDVFTDASVQIVSTTSGEQATFVQAVKQYLCLCLSRNAVSSVLPVFKESCEIFWLVLSGMRTKMKKEIEVLMNEIYLPILEMRTSPPAQKSVLLATLQRLCVDPQALVEVYLNYDCDRTALENLYERLMNVISRLSQAPTSDVPPSVDERDGESIDVRLKRQSLDCLCSVLHSLVEWMDRLMDEPVSTSVPEADDDDTGSQPSADPAAPDEDDDPGRFENAKQRKTVLLEAIRMFNYKPKRGIAQLLEHGFIRSRDPRAIARFLFYADGLSKRSIGEYLGEGDAENIAAMHAFVDLMDFHDMPLTTALRRFLQAFRLPGEAQKIDRYMLKFAERYTEGNKTAFANADTAYKLAYSVIMLNTDAHNPQVKHRMTLQDFIKNNAGLDDDKDLPEEYLRAIYDEIQKNEIKLHGEEAPAMPPSTGLAGAIATVGRDLQHEAYVLQTQGMANRTEVLFRTMLHAQQRRGVHRALADRYFSASHMEHVKPMFEVAWMSFLAGISAPLQDSNEPETIRTALQGFKDAIKIVCFFGLELERNAFITTLGKFTFLNNLGEMRSKNVATIETLLDIAHTEGNFLQGSWREILTCVSQLERFQLISGGVDERMLPELGRRPSAGAPRGVLLPREDVVQQGVSSEITVRADHVFAATPQLSGEAIVEFVQSLCDVSWEEIQSSGMSDNPRLFSLQKVVEISYYNMGRIRMEWSRLWAILGEHFNQVCCHPNPAVSAFALDSLRQLATKFFEKEELLHFSFQKDFLKPFEYVMRRNRDVAAKEMVLQCLDQMMQGRAERIRSGWTTMLGVLGVAASAPERIALYAFDLAQRVHHTHMAAILANGCLAELCVCLAHFGKGSNQRVSLPATELLPSVVPEDSASMELWLPMLFALYDILMTGDDLEVRRVALDALFATLTKHGASFPTSFWDAVCNDVLFPIFNVLRNRSDVTRFSTQEDMSVWLSTTMIQALRRLVALWAVYFDTLKPRLPGLLELLCACICQENDTLARIGTACLQQLLVENIAHMDLVGWQQVTDAFLRLFRATTASQVFDPMLSSPESTVSPAERRQAFKHIIVKCVLQLLLIETANELLRNARVYEAVPIAQLLRLTAALEDSYRFSRRFNADRELRTALWKVGFMKQLPNLLKQESTSASTLVYVYLRMHSDSRPGVDVHRREVSDRFLPLAEEIITGYLPLDNETQARNIAAWTPVVAQVVQGLADMYEADPDAQKAATPTFFLLVVELLDKITLAPTLAMPLRRYLTAVGTAHGFVDLAAAAERERAREEARLDMMRATPLGRADQSQTDLRQVALANHSVEALSPP